MPALTYDIRPEDEDVFPGVATVGVARRLGGGAVLRRSHGGSGCATGSFGGSFVGIRGGQRGLATGLSSGHDDGYVSRCARRVVSRGSRRYVCVYGTRTSLLARVLLGKGAPEAARKLGVNEPRVE